MLKALQALDSTVDDLLDLDDEALRKLLKPSDAVEVGARLYQWVHAFTHTDRILICCQGVSQFKVLIQP